MSEGKSEKDKREEFKSSLVNRFAVLKKQKNYERALIGWKFYTVQSKPFCGIYFKNKEYWEPGNDCFNLK